MIEALMTGLLWFNAIGCSLLAGLYFAFSTFIMTALSQIGPASGIAAMNAINTTIVRSLFMLFFLGTSLASLVLAALALARWSEPGAATMLVGGVVYFAGMFLCTMVFNVPLNSALAATHPESPEGAQVWARYRKEWTLWNHVRTISCIVATALFIMAIAARA